VTPSHQSLAAALLAAMLAAAPVAAQVSIDQTVLDRLGPPRREAAPPAAGPGMGGLSLAPGEQPVARPPPSATPRRVVRPRRAAPVAAAAVAPALAPAIPPAIAPEQDAAPLAAALPLPVPPEFLPPPGPPPLVPLPVPPALAAPPAPPAPALAAPTAPALAAPPAPALAAPPAPALAAPPPPSAPPPPTPAPPAPVLAAPAVPPPAPRATAPATTAARIDFAPGDATLAPAARARLQALAGTIPADDTVTRVLVLGFADQPDGDQSRARRLALARAIEVRTVLLAANVRSTRIDVRALGKPTDGSDPDRVDVSVGSAAPR
jgi:outer membrane protein OmpA-like peptidoglycan-associated protein